jgi:two-component system response regulator YesN
LNEGSKPAIKVAIQDSQYEAEQFKMTSVVDKLLFAMEIGDLSAIERICNEIAMRMIDENYSENIIKKNFIQIISSVLNKLMYEYQDIRETLSNVFTRVFEIENQPKIRALLSFVNSLLAEILEKMDVKNTDVLVKKMINLIERNYDKNIKLETLSKVLNYNRAYLGKLFKDYTGEHFNTYLDKVRIEKAKNLLLQGLKVYQVAERIGFSNVDYFHSKFRKYEGMSPSTYRKSKMMN